MPSTTLSVEADVSAWSSGIAAGAGPHLPVGDYGSADYRAAMRFPIPAGWGAWTALTKATLTFYISDHSHVAPKNSSIYCSRQDLAGLWTKSAGTQNCDSGFTGGNNTQYGDIASVSGSRMTFSSGSTANAAKSLDVTSLVNYYRVYGASKIVFVFDNNGADQYTEIWADEKSGYNATLVLDYEVQSPPTAPTLTGPADGAVSQTDTPTFSWVHNDPQADAQANAQVNIYDAAGTTMLYGWQTGNSNQSLVAPVAFTRGVTYKWAVQTSDATAWGPFSAQRSFTVKALPVVTIATARRMVYNGAPRLAVDWSSDQPQGYFQVTAPGYDSGFRSGGDQSWTLDTLALTNGTPVNVTVTVWNTDSPALQASASRSFTPRWGLTTHKKTLGAVPVNWQAPVVDANVPAGAQVVIEYGSAASAGAGAPTAWYSSITSVPKTQYLWYRVWFIPSATQNPVLNSINIPYDSTVAVLDKWGANIFWPWQAPGGIPARFSIDTGEAVYGTRSLRCDPDGVAPYHVINSAQMKVRQGRSYVLSGLMRTQGAAVAQIRLQNSSAVFVYVEANATASVLTDWERYKTDVWVAPADMDVFVSAICWSSPAGTTAWWDGLKLEESIVATPWNPSTVGATVVDTGGVQIDATKGGLLRYRGTTGGVRDVVEGGANGLLFGGDFNLSSPSAGVLRAAGSLTAQGSIDSDYAQYAPYHLAGSGLGVLRIGGDGASGGKWGLLASGSIPGQYWNQSIHGFIQGRYGTYEVAATVGADAGVTVLPSPVGLTTRTLFDSSNRSLVAKFTIQSLNPIVWYLWFQAVGPWETYEWHPTDTFEEGSGVTIENPAGLGWQTSTAAWGGTEYLSNAYTTLFGGALSTMGFISAGGSGLYESGVRVVQPSGIRINRGQATCVGNGTAITAAGAITFSPAFSSAPILVCTSDNAWRTAAQNGAPSASGAGVIVTDNRGTAIANGTNCIVHWIAIGPA